MELITFIIYASIYIGLIATTFYVLTYTSKRKQEPLFTDKELPKVTILIPAYNEEKTIKRTIQSILKSDYPKDKFEIIVIDNNSTDNTSKITKKFIKSRFNKQDMRKGGRVGTIPNIKLLFEKKQGKGHALNLGIKKSKGEIIFTMDADTEVPSRSLKNMTRYFKDPEIMSVTPAIITQKPKNLLQRIQYIEYVLGLFLRKTFAILNAVHITPGAFSAYRKPFFTRYGGYEPDNVTEDLEVAMRIQFKGYKIQNSPESPAYTNPPEKFAHLLNQRKRWYVGLMKNGWRYKKLVSPKYGDLGMFVLPIAWISIFFAVFVTVYLFIDTLINLKDELLFLQNINYDFSNFLTLNFFFLERFFFRLFTNTVFIFILMFIIVLGIYLCYARRKIGKLHTPFFNLLLFFIFFAILFGFWWIVSIVYVIFNKGVKWK